MKRRAKSVSLLMGDLDNLGDAFLARTEAVYLQAQGYAVFVLPYAKPSTDIASEFSTQGVTVIPMREHPWQALMAVMKGDICIGGGHAIRESLSMAWIVFALCSAALVRLLGGRVILAGAGISPIRTARKARLIRRLLRVSTAVHVRDEGSKLHADELTGRKHARVFTDLAFLNGCGMLSETDPSLCVVSPAYDPHEGRDGDLAQIQDVLRFLTNHRRVKTIRIVAHDGRSDLSACQALLEWGRAEGLAECILFNQASLSMGLLQPYQGAGIVVTGRLHGLIVGLLNGSFVTYTDASANKLRPFGDASGCLPISGLLAGQAIKRCGMEDYLNNLRLEAERSLHLGLVA